MSPLSRIALAGVAIALAATACGGSEEDAGATAPEAISTTAPAATTTTDTVPEITLPPLPPSDYAGFVAQPTACGASTPPPATPMTFDAPEDQRLEAGEPITATVTTSCGDIVVELYPELAPETVNSFVFLARSGYFDGSVSHRVVPGFVIQAGDPTATGRGGPGYTIPDELPEPGFLYEEGALAMANAGPNTTGSQFFIVLADAPLPNAYSYFGKVVAGFDTIERIAELPLGRNALGELGVPLETLYIETVDIAE